MIEATAAEIVSATPKAIIGLDDDERTRMELSAATLERVLKLGRPVYGVTRGFGPLGDFDSNSDSGQQGLNLVNHLSAGHGPELSRESVKLMLRLRLEGMKHGYSGVDVERWQRLVDAYNAGFVPVVPSRGSVSASGDLLPLAHAARAFSGHGEAWIPIGSSHVRLPAADALAKLSLSPMEWEAREALAFVNGSSASLAVALENHARLRKLAWISCAVTGWLVDLFRCSTEPYEEEVATARGGSPGQRQAAEWIRREAVQRRDAAEARRLQEAYSLRCAPQIIGSVLDNLDSSEEQLIREARACSDNPVVAADSILHAGNFHAIGVGLTADLQSLLVHQIAFLAERQLALIVEPSSNGGLPPLLAPKPGATSGLAGLQLAASAMLSEIRQKASPVTTTPVPTNLANQDIVPVALIGCLRAREQLELAEIILGSVAVAAAQAAHLLGQSRSSAWSSTVLELSPRLEMDRPISAEVLEVRDALLAAAHRPRHADKERTDA